MMKRNVIAIGGGKLMVPKNHEPQTSFIDQSIVQQVKRKSPKVLFVPTASEDNEKSISQASLPTNTRQRFFCTPRRMILAASGGASAATASKLAAASSWVGASLSRG